MRVRDDTVGGLADMKLDPAPAIHAIPCGRMSNRTMPGERESVKDCGAMADVVRLVVVASAMLVLWSIY